MDKNNVRSKRKIGPPSRNGNATPQPTVFGPSHASASDAQRAEYVQYQSTSDLSWHKMAAWIHKNKPAAWRGREKHWGPKGCSQFWQRHPPMGGWLAGGTRPSLLHPWWICPHNRSVGRPMSWDAFASFPSQGLARCRFRLVGPVALSLCLCATSVDSIPADSSPVDLGVCSTAPCLGFFQGPSALPVLCPIDRTFHIKSGLFDGQMAGMSLCVPSRVRWLDVGLGW